VSNSTAGAGGSPCALARRNGYAGTDEVVLTTLGARLFAQALGAGTHKTPGAAAKLGQAVALCERGGVVRTRRRGA
jgi:hypothetical protein